MGLKGALIAAIIAVLCALWVAMSEILSSLEEDYPKPFMLTYIVHSGCVQS